MKAAVYTKYGSPDVLKLMKVEKPVPKEHEILIKIYATTVTNGDVRLRASDFPLLFWLPARFLVGLFKLKKEFDVVFDAVGKTTKGKAKRILRTSGIFVSVKMLTIEKKDHLLKLKELAEKEKIKPFIDKYYPLEEIVNAHRYVDQGHKKGNVVIENEE